MLKDHPADNASFPMTEQERNNLKRLADYTSVQSLPEIWPLAAKRFENIVALKDPHTKPEVVLTYAQMYQQIQQFAAGLQTLGITAEADSSGTPTRIALFADNSPRWLIADQGIMTAGAANVVRSAQAEREELLYILEDSGSIGLVAEDLKTLTKLRDRLDSLPIEWVILLSDEKPADSETLKVLNFSQVMVAGASHQLTPATQNRETLATLLYTSGTTGKPKGVMLTHGNLLHQVTTYGAVIVPDPGDRVLSILNTIFSPKVVHRFTRTCAT